MKRTLSSLAVLGAVVAASGAPGAAAARLADDVPAGRHRHDGADHLVRALHAVVHRPDHAARAGACSPIASSSSAPASTRRRRAPATTRMIEVIWTVGPVVILLFLAIPSFQLLTAQYNPPEEPKLTLKATGNQWNWDYEYQIEEPLSFNSRMLADSDRAGCGQDRPGRLSAAADGRQRTRRAGQHHDPRAGDGDRRDPRLRHAGLRRQDRRGAWPHQRDLVQGREGRPLTTASAPSFAARTTPSCRSPSASCRTTSTRPGSRRPATDLGGANKALMAAIDTAARRSRRRPN